VVAWAVLFQTMERETRERGYSSSLPKKMFPCVQLLRVVFIGEGERAAVARGEQGSAEVGWAVGAAGKVRLPWFLFIQGRGASGLGRARGAPELMKTTLFCSAQNSGLFFFTYIYIYCFYLFYL